MTLWPLERKRESDQRHALGGQDNADGSKRMGWITLIPLDRLCASAALLRAQPGHPLAPGTVPLAPPRQRDRGGPQGVLRWQPAGASI